MSYYRMVDEVLMVVYVGALCRSRRISDPALRLLQSSSALRCSQSRKYKCRVCILLRIVCCTIDANTLHGSDEIPQCGT